MLDYLDEVENLLSLPNSTIIAFDLVMDISEYSYGDLDNGGCGYGERSSDKEVDVLLARLAPERRKLKPTWNFVVALDKLQEQAKLFRDYGIEKYCAKTIKLLEGWKASMPADLIFDEPSDTGCDPRSGSLFDFTDEDASSSSGSDDEW
ncbi:hypothetical protein P7C71_g2881, partial [Lecanoromycetidae sp. Uapishka_2]